MSFRGAVRRLARIRSGELIALAGSICVIISLLLPWYGGATGRSDADSVGRLSAWATFGPTIVLLMIGCVAGLVLVLVNVFERTTAAPVLAAVWCTSLGLIATICAIVRVLERPDGASGLETGAWLALAGALALVAGGWQSMRDERPGLYGQATPELRKPPTT